MTRVHPWIIAVAIAALAILLSILRPDAWAIPDSTGTPESLRYMRAGYLYAHSTISVTGTSAKTSELPTDELIRIICTIDVHIDMGGSSVAATTSEMLLPAYTAQYLKTKYDYSYIAAIRAGAVNGTCYVTQVR